MTYTGPTRELANHHDIAVPNRLSAIKVWEIQTRVSALYKAGKIGDADKASCDRWLRDWDSGVAGVVTPKMNERVDSDTIKCALDNRLDALTRLRVVKGMVGEFNALLLEMCLAQDASWVAIGRRIGVSDKPAAAYTVLAIHQLTAAYTSIDSNRSSRRK